MLMLLWSKSNTNQPIRDIIYSIRISFLVTSVDVSVNIDKLVLPEELPLGGICNYLYRGRRH
jgi:hypothetical protein